MNVFATEKQMVGLGAYNTAKDNYPEIVAVQKAIAVSAGRR